MNIEKVKRYSLAELTLFAILVMGLLAAWIIVKQRNHVPLSPPIILDGAGLSVRVPSGAGWESTPEWVYESDNSLALLAQRRPAGQTEVEMRWRYILCAPQSSLMEVLNERLKGTGAIIEPLKMPAGSSMEAAQVTVPKQMYESVYFFAMTNLGYGRTIELQVTPKQSDFDLFYAESLLKDTAKSMTYQMTKEISAGDALLKRFYETLKTDDTKEEAFLINDTRGQASGFFYAKHQPDNGGTTRRIESRHYEAQQFIMESTLQVGQKQQILQWNTRLTTPMSIGMRLYEMRLDENGRLKITSNFEKEKTLSPDPYVLPELLLTEYVRLYMESKEPSVVTLVLAGIGPVVPVRIRSIELQDAAAQSQDAAWAVRVEYLHAANFYDEIYFNEQNEIIGRFERQPRRSDRLWDKTTPDELKRVFGDKLNAAPQKAEAGI